jgi:hypothetical protein
MGHPSGIAVLLRTLARLRPRLMRPGFLQSVAFVAIGFPATLTPVAAFPVLSDLNAVATQVPGSALPLVQVRDVCRVYYEGSTKVTRYCDPPYVCDRANPGKCKPGPELQRQLDAERQQRDEALRSAQQKLNQMRREMEAQIRNLRRSSRATYFARKDNALANDRRASSCKNVIMFGQPARVCAGEADKGRLSSNAYNDRIIPSPQYGKPRTQQPRPVYGAPPRTAVPRVTTAAPRTRPPTLRTQVTLGILAHELSKLKPDDPDRVDLERRIIEKAKKFEALGEDVAPFLKKIMEKAVHDSVESDQERNKSIADATPAPAPATSAPAQAAPPPKPYSDNDEALCSFHMSLAPDERDLSGRITRLGRPVPDYCQPYLNSLPKPEAQPEPEPAFYLPERDKEEACALAEAFYRENVLPPNFADLDAAARGGYEDRAKCQLKR